MWYPTNMCNIKCQLTLGKSVLKRKKKEGKEGGKTCPGWGERRGKPVLAVEGRKGRLGSPR